MVVEWKRLGGCLSTSRVMQVKLTMCGVIRYDASEASVYDTAYSVKPPPVCRLSLDLNSRCNEAD